ncbi:MAG: hypothetical protein V1689_16375 [Pseudomonadota bacterium]
MEAKDPLSCDQVHQLPLNLWFLPVSGASSGRLFHLIPGIAPSQAQTDYRLAQILHEFVKTLSFSFLVIPVKLVLAKAGNENPGIQPLGGLDSRFRGSDGLGGFLQVHQGLNGFVEQILPIDNKLD